MEVSKRLHGLRESLLTADFAFEYASLAHVAPLHEEGPKFVSALLRDGATTETMTSQGSPIGCARVAREEVFLPFKTARERIPMATKFRSTWLASSLASLRREGLFDAYLGLLPGQHHEAILGAVAGVWLPIQVADVHYAACERLPIDSARQYAIGYQTSRRAHGNVVDLVLRGARGAGVTPWTALAQLQRLWEHTWEGGGVSVTKLGPKEARIEIIQWPIARYRYNRGALRGIHQGVFESFCSKLFVQEILPLCTHSTLGFRLSWV